MLAPRFRVGLFLKNVQITETCWLWTGRIDRGGYGRYGENGGGAHRTSYEWFVGPIPDGLHIDHLCRVRRCVNPDHLEPVTCRENLMRGEGIAVKNARKTHCKYGHPFTPESTYNERGHRMCRECTRAYHQAYWAVRKVKNATGSTAALSQTNEGDVP